MCATRRPISTESNSDSRDAKHASPLILSNSVTHWPSLACVIHVSLAVELRQRVVRAGEKVRFAWKSPGGSLFAFLNAIVLRTVSPFPTPIDLSIRKPTYIRPTLILCSAFSDIPLLWHVRTNPAKSVHL